MNQYIGQLLDNRYELLEVIGTGGMAVVYKARCHRLNRLVAVKVLKDEFSGDEEFRRRFRAEGEAVAMLSHPNIVQVFDVSASDNAYYIVMELIDGISLKQYMEVKGILNWKETLHFATQIAKGLEHAHSRGIVHRDIKPHNVMVLKNGSVKVMDFGIAQVMNKSSTLTKEALGSVHYISPEQAKGSYTDSRSDIYSLGVVMYEMMTGRPPYDGDSPVAVAIQHINGGAPMPTTLNPNIPAGMEQMIMKAMALEPKDRYASATELLTDLEEFRKNPALTFQYRTLADEATKKLTPIVSKPKTTAQRVAQAKGGVMSVGNPNMTVRQGTGRVPEPVMPSSGRSPEALARAKKRREEEARRDAQRSRTATIAVVSCSVVAIIAIVVFLAAIFNGFLINQDRGRVEVPYLTGSMYTEDFDALYPNFTIRLRPQQYDDFYVMGQIMHQEPAGGLYVAKGTEIFLTISMGPEPKVKLMEDLTGVTQDRATSFLIGQGLKTLIREEANDEYPNGYVIRTEPAAGAELTDGQTVKLYVSTGPDKEVAKMPNVLNVEKEMALQVLEQLGFRNVSTTPVYSSKISKGNVVTQSETANTMIDVTTHIILEISDGPEIPTAVMPDVMQLDVETAIKVLEAKGFQSIQTYPMDSSLPKNQVANQSEDPNSVVALSKEILLGVSNGNSSAAAPTTPTTEPPVSTTPGRELVTFDVPVRTESYILIICRKGQADQQVASGVVQPGDNLFTVELSDTGVQEYDLYINGEYYQSMKVTFKNNG
ncbi:MAG: Stk1 family PASTA domain-containing Ser/Thr kinase [Faecousia sp.]